MFRDIYIYKFLIQKLFFSTFRFIPLSRVKEKIEIQIHRKYFVPKAIKRIEPIVSQHQIFDCTPLISGWIIIFFKIFWKSMFFIWKMVKIDQKLRKQFFGRQIDLYLRFIMKNVPSIERDDAEYTRNFFAIFLQE